LFYQSREFRTFLLLAKKNLIVTECNFHDIWNNKLISSRKSWRSSFFYLPTPSLLAPPCCPDIHVLSSDASASRTKATDRRCHGNSISGSRTTNFRSPRAEGATSRGGTRGDGGTEGISIPAFSRRDDDLVGRETNFSRSSRTPSLHTLFAPSTAASIFFAFPPVFVFFFVPFFLSYFPLAFLALFRIRNPTRRMYRRETFGNFWRDGSFNSGSFFTLQVGLRAREHPLCVREVGVENWRKSGIPRRSAAMRA